MPPITAQEVRNRLGIRGGVQNGANVLAIDDDAIDRMVEAAQAQIESRWGLDALEYPDETAREFTLRTTEKPYGLFISRRPASITSVAVGTETLDADDYALEGQHLVRASGSQWGSPLTVTYTAVDADSQRIEAIVALIDIWMTENQPNALGNRVSNRLNGAVEAVLARVGRAERGIAAI